MKVVLVTGIDKRERRWQGTRNCRKEMSGHSGACAGSATWRGSLSRGIQEAADWVATAQESTRVELLEQVSESTSEL